MVVLVFFLCYIRLVKKKSEEPKVNSRFWTEVNTSHATVTGKSKLNFAVLFIYISGRAIPYTKSTMRTGFTNTQIFSHQRKYPWSYKHHTFHKHPKSNASFSIRFSSWITSLHMIATFLAVAS